VAERGQFAAGRGIESSVVDLSGGAYGTLGLQWFASMKVLRAEPLPDGKKQSGRQGQPVECGALTQHCRQDRLSKDKSKKIP
jgi:hypothetical protein